MEYSNILTAIRIDLSNLRGQKYKDIAKRKHGLGNT